MRVTSIAALFSALPACLATAAAAAPAGDLKTSITLSIPPSQFLSNPSVLPPSTHATLTALRQTYSAPLTVANTFVFHNVTPGSYLADVQSASYGFAPLRVDVTAAEDGAAGADARSVVRVWETYRGNEWENKGEQLVKQGDGGFSLRCLGKKVFFQERGKFSVLTILKNPMILLGLVSMGIFFGMPKLVENMDPEMRAEWEEQQKKSPMNNIMGGAQGGGNPLSSFDMASFMAGSGEKNGEGSSGNGGKKGGKR